MQNTQQDNDTNKKKTELDSRPFESSRLGEKKTSDTAEMYGDGDRIDFSEHSHPLRKPADLIIKEEAWGYIEDDAYIDSSNIKIEVKDCLIFLSGTVNNKLSKRKAADLMKDVEGLKGIQNNIKVLAQEDRT